MKLLLVNGTELNKKKYLVEVHSFICDAPPKAFVKCIKPHRGYSNCDKYMETGEYFEGSLIYRSISSLTRSYHSFRIQHDDDHHLDNSSLKSLNSGQVTSFPIDYMH